MSRGIDYRDDCFDWFETINRTMECLLDVLSNIFILEQQVSVSSLLTSLNKNKYHSIDKALKSYLTEANKLIATLLSYHPKVSGEEFTSTGWRDESEFRKKGNKTSNLRKHSRTNPDLDLTISFLREIGSLLSLHAKLLHHLKINS